MGPFDTIVIGSGSAGCVLAEKLSRDPVHTVCLIEAGPPDHDLRIRVPLGVVSMIGHRQYDWRYES